MLARRVGVRRIALVEDAVQSALMAALRTWTEQDLPDDPGAWLYKAAYNRLIQDLRQESGRLKILERVGADLSNLAVASEGPFFPNEIRDDMLRMLFVCCDDGIPLKSRLVLALKTLCGFSTAEIALRLFTSEANVHKRLARARDRLRESLPDVETPPLEMLRSRLAGVHAVLYLLFNEGYLSVHADHAIRHELCDEAVRLTTLLSEHPVGAVPETFALLALMHLHAARLGSRVDGTGALLLLEEQDRSQWDRQRIAVGVEWLTRSAAGDVLSRFHVEAGIAAEHCLAPSFEQTRWGEIAELYADAGASRSFTTAHVESSDCGRRMARAGRRSLVARRLRAAGMAIEVVSVRRRVRRLAPSCGTLGSCAATCRPGAALGSQRGGARSARTRLATSDSR